MDKIQKIREGVEKRYEYWREKESNSHSIESEIRMSECQHLLLMLDSLQEEPVSEDLEETCEQLAENARKHKAETISPFFSLTDYKQGVIDGANWKNEQFEKDYTDLCNGIATAKGLAVTMAYDKGMADAREQMMAKAVDATLLEGHLIRQKGVTHPLHVGDKVKLIVIKED